MRRYRICAAWLLSLSTLLFLVLFFLSTLVKNWLIQHSQELIGRKLEIGALQFQYFKASVRAQDIVLYEAESQDIFVSLHELYLDFDPWNLLQGEYSFSEIRFQSPEIRIMRQDSLFNFQDLIADKANPQPRQPSDSESSSLKFSIKNIQLQEGRILYRDEFHEEPMVLDQINLTIPLIAWNNTKSQGGIRFQLGEQGQVAMDADLDTHLNSYTLTLTTSGIDLKPFSGYLKPHVNSVDIKGFFSSDIKVTGRLDSTDHIVLTGETAVSGFQWKDRNEKPVCSWENLKLSIKSIDLKSDQWNLSGIEITEPSLHLTLNKEVSNLEQLWNSSPEPPSQSIDSSEVSSLSQSMAFRIDSVKLNHGVLFLEDNTLNRPFQYQFGNIQIKLAGITETADNIPLQFSLDLLQGGNLQGSGKIHSENPLDIEFSAHLKKLDLSSFSPYSEYYLAYPITQGWMDYDLSLKMSPQSLDNQNRILMEEIEFGRRTHDKTAIKAPVKLGLYLMKDNNDRIKIDLPISGNPSDPQFKPGKLLWQAFSNLMAKTVASPFIALTNLTGTNPEKLERIPFAFLQDTLSSEQKEVLNTLASLLSRKSDLMLLIIQHTHPETEKKQLGQQLFLDGFLKDLHMTDSTVILKTEEETLDRIRKMYPLVDSLGLENMAMQLISPDTLDSSFRRLLEQRNLKIRNYLIQETGFPEQSIQVSTADLRNLPEQLQIPHFKVEVVLVEDSTQTKSGMVTPDIIQNNLTLREN